MKVEKLSHGKLYIECPACGMGHAPDERWTFNGDYERPTFNPSLLVSIPGYRGIANYKCHSYIRDGKIQYLNDSTHDLAGQTVELPETDM